MRALRHRAPATRTTRVGKPAVLDGSASAGVRRAEAADSTRASASLSDSDAHELLGSPSGASTLAPITTPHAASKQGAHRNRLSSRALVSAYPRVGRPSVLTASGPVEQL